MMLHLLAVLFLFVFSGTEARNSLLKGFKISIDVHRGNTIDDMQHGAAALIKRDQNGVETELLNKRTYYMADIKVGSKKDKVSVLVDTGSSDLWVMANKLWCKAVVTSSNQYYVKQETKTLHKLDKNKNYRSTYNLEVFSNTVNTVPQYTTPSYGTLQSGVASTSRGYRTIAYLTPSVSYTSASTCTDYGSFNSGDSDTFKRNDSASDFFISYVDGTVAKGLWGTDDVEIGGSTVESMYFGVVNETDSKIAILGIGLDIMEVTNLMQESSPYRYENLPVKLKSEGIIDKIAYSLYLGDTTSKKGSILFGAVDHAKYSGTLEKVPILTYGAYYSPTLILIKLDSLAFDNNGKELTIGSLDNIVILDSGSTLTYLPIYLLNRIGRMLNGRWSSIMETYEVNCTSDDSYKFIFNFSGKKIEVPLSSLLLRGPFSNCYLGIRPAYSSYGSLGDNFLRNAYVVFDLEDKEVSLAQAKYSDDEDVEVISSTVPGAKEADGYSSTTIVIQSEESVPIESYKTGELTNGGWSPFESTDGSSYVINTRRTTRAYYTRTLIPTTRTRSSRASTSLSASSTLNEKSTSEDTKTTSSSDETPTSNSSSFPSSSSSSSSGSSSGFSSSSTSTSGAREGGNSESSLGSGASSIRLLSIKAFLFLTLTTCIFASVCL